MKKTLLALLALSTSFTVLATLPQVGNADKVAICQYLLEENYQVEVESEAQFMINYCVEKSQFSYNSYPTGSEREVETAIWFSPYYTHRCTVEMSFDQVGMASCQ